MYSWPPWDWATGLLEDPLLAPLFVWDAQHLYKYNGIKFEWFINEPWTADHWWKIQSSLPNNGVPFAIILYADKTHLSSSGNVKGYPVIACCANLPVNVRNGDCFGGGYVVGWLAIVPEDSDEDHKHSYVNLKHVVWHRLFLKLLESIILLSKTGFAHKCFDGILHWLYPLILILSADYEEQCVMALIRGPDSACPCPICLVPKDKLTDHAKSHPIQIPEDAQACVELFNQNHKAGESALKRLSL
ncbi:hypothetical protein ID866_12268 [Astraeus odoratus]|nr:hypothetical protein ID866_12268 [Astraeus odoratus]